MNGVRPRDIQGLQSLRTPCWLAHTAHSGSGDCALRRSDDLRTMEKLKSATLKPCLSCTDKRRQEATATWPVARCSTGGEGSVAGRSARISKPAEFAGSECVCCQAGWACRNVQLALYDYTSTSRHATSCAVHRSRGARCKPEGTLRTLKPCCTACANQAQPASYGRSSFCMPCSACMPGTARRGWWRCCRQQPQIRQ